MNIYSAEGIKDILKSSNLFLSKSRGQNYLKDESVAQKISKSITENTSDPSKVSVIEVGSGIGSLTVQLSKYFNKIASFEIDKGIFLCFSKTLEEYNIKNVIPLHKDFLKFNLNEIQKILNVTEGNETIFVSNLPYSVGGEILKRVFYEMHYVSKIFVMIQKEFFERITAIPGSKNYSYLSVIYQLETKQIQKIMDIPKNHFFPTPSVDSVFVYIEKSENQTSESEREIIKTLFSTKRKTIFKSLKLYMKNQKKPDTIIEEILRTLGIPQNERIEKLPPDTLLKLSRLIKIS